MRVTIFDYGVGNLHSLVQAVLAAGGEPQVTSAAVDVAATGALVLPGVGAFAPAAARLDAGRDTMQAAILGGLPTLGICLGMQLLFEGSDEGPGRGLGVFAGRATRLQANTVPHIGWNSLDEANDPLLAASGLCEVYYAHSFACRTTDPGAVVAWTTHEGDRFPAVVRRARCVGAQFHPEKSSTRGVAFLRAFLARGAE